MSAQFPLFSPDLISPAVLSALPERYTMRPLRCADFNNGILDVLRVLTTVGEISEAAWVERYEWMAKKEDEYYILVVCDGEGKIVGTGTVFVERKLYVHSVLCSYSIIPFLYSGGTTGEGISMAAYERVIVFTALALWATSRTLSSIRTNRARNLVYGSLRHWIISPRRLGATRCASDP